MTKRKICVVVTARPSYSRIKTALAAIQAHSELELQLLVAGSALIDRYGMTVNVMREDGFEPTACIYSLVEGENLTTSVKTTAVGMLELATLFEKLAPDFVVTVADRYETIATAIAASYMNIPLVHLQGGEVTGNIDEKVRHAVTKLADYHFVASEAAHRRVLGLGEDPACVFNTGCPSIDLASQVMADPAMDFDPYKKYGGVGSFPELSAGYLVVMQHPVTTEPGAAAQQARQTLQAVQALGMPTLWFWPNVDAGSDETASTLRKFREKGGSDFLHFFKNMDPEDFLRLLIGCRCLIGNSSVGVRECSFLAVPTVNIGTRQNGRDHGSNVLDAAHDPDAIRAAVEAWLARPRPEPDDIYGGGQAGIEMARLLAEIQPRFTKRLLDRPAGAADGA